MTPPSKTRDVIIQTPPLLVGRADAARALGISERTFEALVASGVAPPARKISRQRVGWLWRELVAFAESLPISDLQGPGVRAATE